MPHQSLLRVLLVALLSLSVEGASIALSESHWLEAIKLPWGSLSFLALIAFLPQAATAACTSSSTSSCTSSFGSCVNRAADYPKTATEWDYLSVPTVVSGVTQVNSGSWSDINQVCVDRGLQLCQSDNFCTGGVPPSGIDISQHDSWIAVGDSENEWFTFRRGWGWGDRICKTHTEVAGSKPSWGTTSFTGTTGDMFRAGICCGTCSSTPSPPPPTTSSTGASDFSTCCDSKLVHWFDFSDTDDYGLSELATMSSFTDKMSGATSMTVNYNVKYKLNVQNGLNAIYANEQYASLQFSSNSGTNPEVFIAYRIVNNVGGRSLPHGYIFGGRAGTRSGRIGRRTQSLRTTQLP